VSRSQNHMSVQAWYPRQRYNKSRCLANLMCYSNLIEHPTLQLKPYIASTASRFAPEIRRSPDQL
jgi:hypothetical protein